MKRKKITAIYLTAGKGSRMNTNIQKQYLDILGQPLMVYGLKEMEQHEKIDEIILVVSKGNIEYCLENIVKPYGLSKVVRIIEGGRERFDSVYLALNHIDVKTVDYVLIHDGARPLITQVLIEKCIEEVVNSKACVVGVPVKDTIKKINQEGYIIDTPKRKSLYAIQTPQVFATEIIKEAYSRFYKEKKIDATDDAMLVETYTNYHVKVIEGDYKNIKVTTPEDIKVVEAYLKEKS